MKYKKILLLTLAIPFAASCGGGNLAVKDDNAAKEIVATIVKAQADEDLFQLPNKFTLKTTTKSSSSANTPVGSGSKSTTEVGEINFDLDNLIYRTYSKSQEDSASVETEIYYFFNNDDGKYYVCSNNNGYKTRTEESSSTEIVKQKLLDFRKTYCKDDICGTELTSNFENKVKNYSEQHEKYKNEKDQYFNYTFGSNDSKSFQTIIDSKIKKTEDDLEGYAISKYNGIIKENLCVSVTTSAEVEVKDTTGQFYIKSNATQSSSGSYGNTTINKPNIKDYTK